MIRKARRAFLVKKVLAKVTENQSGLFLSTSIGKKTANRWADKGPKIHKCYRIATSLQKKDIASLMKYRMKIFLNYSLLETTTSSASENSREFDYASVYHITMIPRFSFNTINHTCLALVLKSRFKRDFHIFSEVQLIEHVTATSKDLRFVLILFELHVF